MDVVQLAENLIGTLRAYGSAAVAFSAGVDSTVVAYAAHAALGDAAVAVTGVGPALPQGELEAARGLAGRIGIAHVEAPTGEMQRQAYTRNSSDRCFHCKKELYGHVARVALTRGITVLVNGANTDDLGDYRPGLAAAGDFHVRSPLIDCGADKAAVRRLAAYWRLPVAQKPASPCLASRLAYGVEVTAARLERVDEAERLLRSMGVEPVRVRLHPGELARIEAPVEHIQWLAEPLVRRTIDGAFGELGFCFVSLDLAGFRSGSLNTLVTHEIDARYRYSAAERCTSPSG